MKRRLSLFSYTILFLVIILLDRLTKQWALALPKNGIIVNQFLSFHLAFNRGISWGLFNGPSHLLFISMTGIILLIIGALAFHAFITYKNEQPIFGHVLALAGALSNVIDRFIFGGVIDFIVLSIGDWQWPTFNVADVAIVCGVFIMVLWYKKW